MASGTPSDPTARKSDPTGVEHRLEHRIAGDRVTARVELVAAKVTVCDSTELSGQAEHRIERQPAVDEAEDGESVFDEQWLRRFACRVQTAVAQKVSPWGNDCCSSGSVSPLYRALSMPLTMPRSTAQITGCSIATSPKGQWLLTIRNWLLR